MADQPKNPGLAKDPMRPDPRRDLTPDEQANAHSDPYGPQELGDDEAAGGADSSPYENTSPADRPAAANTASNRGSGETRNS